MNLRLTATLVLIPVLVAACKNRQKSEQPVAIEETTSTKIEPLQKTADTITTMELDPADPIDIGGWWYNGEVIIEISYDYGYVIRRGRTMNAPLIERGRWTRDNHAEFHLETYTKGISKPERAALSIENGVPTATITGLPPFQKLARRPREIGEELEGTWKGARGTIAFDSKGTFLLAPRSGSVKSIPGTWTIDHAALVLEPSDPAHEPIVLLFQRSRDGRLVGLQDIEGPFLPLSGSHGRP